MPAKHKVRADVEEDIKPDIKKLARDLIPPPRPVLPLYTPLPYLSKPLAPLPLSFSFPPIPIVTMSEEPEQKPVVNKEDKPKITIQVQFEGRSTAFAVKMNTRFEKVFKTAESQFGVGEKTLRFTYDGTRIREQETPGDLDMEDNDIIDAHVEQLGGGFLPPSQ